VGNYSILEPSKEIEYKYNSEDLIIVPGVAFDKYNNRLGRGKGYYDRFLDKYPMYSIGVAFNEQVVNMIPCDSKDKKVDILLTETQID